jgi:hypothetical protein
MSVLPDDETVRRDGRRALMSRLARPSVLAAFPSKSRLSTVPPGSRRSPFPHAASLQSRHIFGPVSFQGTKPGHVSPCKHSTPPTSRSHHQRTLTDDAAAVDVPRGRYWGPQMGHWNCSVIFRRHALPLRGAGRVLRGNPVLAGPPWSIMPRFCVSTETRSRAARRELLMAIGHRKEGTGTLLMGLLKPRLPPGSGT